MCLDEQMLLVAMETDLIIVRTACVTLYSTHLATNPTLIAFQQLLSGKRLSFFISVMRQHPQRGSLRSILFRYTPPPPLISNALEAAEPKKKY
jgi:hypothetical protein